LENLPAFQTEAECLMKNLKTSKEQNNFHKYATEAKVGKKLGEKK